MVFVLIIGDFHIPQRTNDLPTPFKKMLVPGKIEKIFCTGNLCIKEIHSFLKKINPDLHVVKGEYDDPELVKKEAKIVKLNGWKFGLIHGHQIVPWGDREALATYQRKMDVDVLVSGYTHEYDLYEYENKFYINPGSATGAYNPTIGDGVPSFVLMDVQTKVITNYVYQLIKGSVQVKKKIFKRVEEDDEEEEEEEQKTENTTKPSEDEDES